MLFIALLYQPLMMMVEDECGAIVLQVGSWVWAYNTTPGKSTVTKPWRRSRPKEVCDASNEETGIEP
jgi:hypothetical protein